MSEAVPAEKKAERTPSEWDFANFLEKCLPETKTVGHRWFCYDHEFKGVWQETDPNIFRPRAHLVYPTKLRSERRVQTLLKHLESRWQDKESIFRGAICFLDNECVLVNTLNGVLAVRPGSIELLPHEARYYFTRCLQVSYDPTARCPLYSQTLSQCLPDPEDHDLFVLCMGNFLLPDCRFEVALVCYGEAGSGKSTLARPITDLFGTADKGLMTRLSMSQLCDPNCYALAKLRYACVNLGTELQSIAVDESANFKTIVSGEPLEARPIYSPPFTMHTHCKLWFLANNLPRFKNGTDAELRRTRFLRFEFKTSRPDVLLKEKLAAESPGVFNLMLGGLQRALTLETMPLGGSHSRNVHERFKVSNDPLGTFVSQYCRVSVDGEVEKDRLDRHYETYCQMHNLSKGMHDHFFKHLYERFPTIVPVRVRRGGERVHMVRGIVLTEAALSSLCPEVVREGVDGDSTLKTLDLSNVRI